MMHPDARLTVVNEKIGVGLIANKRIPKGTITWCRDDLDLVLTRKQLKTLPKLARQTFQKYCTRMNDGDYLLNWDNGRYQNHSCNPTSCLLPGFDCEISLRDIEEGEQITSDYATYNLSKDSAWACICNEPACRGSILVEDQAERLNELIQLVAKAQQYLKLVEQPLDFLTPHFPGNRTMPRYPRTFLTRLRDDLGRRFSK